MGHDIRGQRFGTCLCWFGVALAVPRVAVTCERRGHRSAIAITVVSRDSGATDQSSPG